MANDKRPLKWKEGTWEYTCGPFKVFETGGAWLLAIKNNFGEYKTIGDWDAGKGIKPPMEMAQNIADSIDFLY